MQEEEWIRHILVVGMSGQGKTNFCFKILQELKRKNKPFLVFDWKKGYRDLLQLEEFKNLQVFTVAKQQHPFYFNPLIPPPKTDPGEWIVKLVDVIGHSYFEGLGVESLLREAIHWLYDKCGMYQDTPHEQPTFIKLKDYLSKRVFQGREGLWKSSAMRALKSLSFEKSIGPVVNPPDGKNWNYQQILSSNVILELDALANADKTFLAESIILWLYEYRKNQANRETFKHALLVEEAHHIFSREKEQVSGGETIMETCIRQIRELGEACIIVDQMPTLISNSLIANTYTKVCFNLGSGKDITEISRCMFLNNEETEYINMLETGHAIITLKDRIFVPLHVKVPKIQLEKGMIKDVDLVAIKSSDNSCQLS